MCDPGPQHRVGEKPDAIELDDGRRMPHVGDPANRHRSSHHHTELSAAERAIALSAADNSAPALRALVRGARCRRVCSESSVSAASRPPLLGTLREHGFIAANYDRACDLRVRLVPPAGFEPAPPPPEGGALSPELRGLGHAEASSARAMIIGVEVVPVASPLWLVPGVSSSSMTTM